MALRAKQGGSSLGVLILLSIPFVRKISYEFFLRSHQFLAAAIAYSTWRHRTPHTTFDWWYIYVFIAVFSVLLALQWSLILFRNLAWRGHMPRAVITRTEEAITIELKLTSRPLALDSGQYIVLYMPFISFWSFSFLQSHPFIVTSWAPSPQETLELFVQPRRGLTSRYLSAKPGVPFRTLKSGPFRALISGPHGISTPMSEYETVLMVATGFGIAAQLPHLSELIHGYNTSQTRTKRVHLVWQMPSLGKPVF
jgi:hypothetical protein